MEWWSEIIYRWMLSFLLTPFRSVPFLIGAWSWVGNSARFDESNLAWKIWSHIGLCSSGRPLRHNDRYRLCTTEYNLHNCHLESQVYFLINMFFVPVPTEYAWFHDNKAINFTEKAQLYSIFTNHSLYISVVTDLTIGNYSCQASANSQVLLVPCWEYEGLLEYLLHE